MSSLKRKNFCLLAVLGIVVTAMVGMSYASVPLYDLFCRVTGFGGTTQVALMQSNNVTQRPINVRFDAMTTKINWAFQPMQRQIELKVGENAVAFYQATNHSPLPLTGTATFNVTPLKAGAYFNKIDCFCFTEQTLNPGQTIEMPVSFFIDPEIESDPNLNDVRTITLSYTFYPADVGEIKLKEPQVTFNSGS